MDLRVIRGEIDQMRRQILRQRKEIQDLNGPGSPPLPLKSCSAGCRAKLMGCAPNATA
jgi:hypothetical protein